MLSYALESEKPILGICRGHQLINLQLGGELVSHIRGILGAKALVKTLFPRKRIELTGNSKILAPLLDASKERSINAIHDQAIVRAGEGLEVVAVDDQGIIQATEFAKKNILTVQWHPEYLQYRSGHQEIFNWLVQATKKASKENYEKQTA